jgi:hypothetical protein
MLVRFARAILLSTLAIGFAARLPAAEASNSAAFDDEPLSGVVRQVILNELKDKYEDDKNWGHQREALRGFRVRGSVIRPRFEKRTKPVNDGFWQRYVVTVVEPEQQLRVGLDNLRLVENGRIAFTLRLSARLRGDANVEQWERGVKLFGTSGQGDAIVSATIDCDVGIRFEPGKLTSDVLLDPHVGAIHLDLVDLDVKRLSHFGGKMAHEIGDSFTPMVARQLKRREGKIADKANASIAKHRDRLRLPLNEFLTSGLARLEKLAPKSPISPAEERPAANQEQAAGETAPADTAQGSTEAAAAESATPESATPESAAATR